MSLIQVYLARVAQISRKVWDKSTWSRCCVYVGEKRTSRFHQGLCKQPWPECSMFLITSHMYHYTVFTLYKMLLYYRKCIKIKAVQQGKIEMGAFELSLCTKQWFQMWKRPERCRDILSTLTGCSLQPTSWVCTSLASLQSNVSPSFDQCEVFGCSNENNLIWCSWCCSELSSIGAYSELFSWNISKRGYQNLPE